MWRTENTEIKAVILTGWGIVPTPLGHEKCIGLTHYRLYEGEENQHVDS